MEQTKRMYGGYHLPKLEKPQSIADFDEPTAIRKALALLDGKEGAEIESNSWPIGDFGIKKVSLAFSGKPKLKAYAAVHGLFGINIMLSPYSKWFGVSIYHGTSNKRYAVTHIPTGLSAKTGLTIEQAVTLVKALDRLKLDWNFSDPSKVNAELLADFLAIKKEVIGDD